MLVTFRVVPPTASTFGEDEGYATVDESPDEATKVMPLCPEGVVKTLS